MDDPTISLPLLERRGAPAGVVAAWTEHYPNDATHPLSRVANKFLDHDHLDEAQWLLINLLPVEVVGAWLREALDRVKRLGPASIKDLTDQVLYLVNLGAAYDLYPTFWAEWEGRLRAERTRAEDEAQKAFRLAVGLFPIEAQPEAMARANADAILTAAENAHYFAHADQGGTPQDSLKRFVRLGVSVFQGARKAEA